MPLAPTRARPAASISCRTSFFGQKHLLDALVHLAKQRPFRPRKLKRIEHEQEAVPGASPILAIHKAYGSQRLVIKLGRQ